MLLHLIQSSKRAPCCIARVLGGHALRDELVFEELQVRIDFPREIGLGMTGAEE